MIARFSLSWGSSSLNRVKFIIRRASRTRSQRGAHGAGLGRSCRECKRHFALFKAVLRPVRAAACESAALGCLPSRWEGITGMPRKDGGGQSLSGRNALCAGCPVGVLLNACFLSSYFSDWRAWNRRRRWLATLGPFIAGCNVDFNGWVGGESMKLRVFFAGSPAGAPAP